MADSAKFDANNGAALPTWSTSRKVNAKVFQQAVEAIRRHGLLSKDDVLYWE
ncbi:MAG: hypothetical protein ACLPY5_13240 [Candidatus Bathyarchaeia archaeon]